MLFISKHPSLRVLIEEPEEIITPMGKMLKKPGRYADFVGKNFNCPDTDTKAIAVLMNCRYCKPFKDCEKVLTEDGKETIEIVNENEFVTKKEAVALVGSEKILKEEVALGNIKIQKTTGGTRYNLRQINEYCEENKAHT